MSNKPSEWVAQRMGDSENGSPHSGRPMEWRPREWDAQNVRSSV